MADGMTTFPRIIILGRSEAAMFLRKRVAADVRAVIMIHGQREYPLETPGIGKRLVLRFDDTPAPSDMDPIHAARIRLRQQEAKKIGLELCPPTVDDARSIIEFAESIRDLGGVLLCQCQAGISRSPAAALLCLTAWAGPGHERDCVAYLLQVRPSAVPHLDLVRFGDDVLRLNGALVEAIGAERF